MIRRRRRDSAIDLVVPNGRAPRVIYNYGHFDGEHGLAPRSVQFTERQREIYDHAYGKGADLRYRARENVQRHANKIRARRELT
jgi:hypothetical protein